MSAAMSAAKTTVFSITYAKPKWLQQINKNYELILIYLRGRGVIDTKCDPDIDTNQNIDARNHFWQVFTEALGSKTAHPLCATMEDLSRTGAKWTKCNDTSVFPESSGTNQYPHAIWMLWTGAKDFPLKPDQPNKLKTKYILTDKLKGKEKGCDDISNKKATHGFWEYAHGNSLEKASLVQETTLLAEAIACQHLLKRHPYATLAALHDAICKCSETPSTPDALPVTPDESPNTDQTAPEPAAGNNQPTE